MINITNFKKKQVENGITLITLVITIIVLLILAGVSIAILAGDNGVLLKANTAKDKTRKSSCKRKSTSSCNGKL